MPIEPHTHLADPDDARNERHNLSRNGVAQFDSSARKTSRRQAADRLVALLERGAELSTKYDARRTSFTASIAVAREAQAKAYAPQTDFDVAADKLGASSSVTAWEHVAAKTASTLDAVVDEYRLDISKTPTGGDGVEQPAERSHTQTSSRRAARLGREFEPFGQLFNFMAPHTHPRPVQVHPCALSPAGGGVLCTGPP